MDAIHFEWDRQKASLNKRKHGISFDPDHSESEDRFVMLGLSFRLRTLVVCYCVREENSIIRIISARKATRQESSTYWEEKP